MTISNNQTISLRDIMYEKNHVCPVCHSSFGVKMIEDKKNQPLTVDADLYTRYAVINPIPYKVILCNGCGYAAMEETFDALSEVHKTTMQKKVMPNYKKHTFSLYPSVSDAIFKYKMALLCAILKKAPIGEQAYIALHLGWLYRDLKEPTLEDTFLMRAINGFKLALETDSFPIFSLDKITVIYLVAIISHRLHNTEVAKEYLNRIPKDYTSSPIHTKISELTTLIG